MEDGDREVLSSSRTSHRRADAASQEAYANPTFFNLTSYELVLKDIEDMHEHASGLDHPR